MDVIQRRLEGSRLSGVMFRLAITPIGLLVLSACASGDAVPADDSFRVMSFNIRYGTARDGANHWNKRKGLVVRTVRTYDPDLLGLQEVLPFQARHMQRALTGHDSYGPSRQGANGESCTLFWRRDRFEVMAKATFWLSPTPDKTASRGWDAALPRICSWVRLHDRRTGCEFVFANTHFDHRGRQARRESADLIAQRLLAQRPGGKTLILTGDFNAAESSRPLERLRSAGFRDAFRVAHPTAKDVGTFTGFKPRSGGRKIDYVLVHGAGTVIEAAIDRSCFEGRWPSDHLPVTASLRIPR